MSNQIKATGRYKEQIQDLKDAIAYLEESDNYLGYKDDGSGIEYTEEQHKKGRELKEKALDSIAKANNVLMNER